MPAGLPAPPENQGDYVEASCPPFTIYVARDVWDEAQQSGEFVVSMGEYGRFRLRLTGHDTGQDTDSP